jgi:hypothetical protein
VTQAIAILIPLLGRSDQVSPLYDSIRYSEGEILTWPYFLISPHDIPNMQAVSLTGASH